MRTQTAKSEFMFLFRGNDWHKGLSPEEIQKVSNAWMSWFERLNAQGKVIAGSPLEPEGKIVAGRGRVIADGPFAESKEAIGGYFLLRVQTFDEAVAIAKECPGLIYGAQVEVRPVAEQCPLLSETASGRQLARITA
jgi:hypothetical protein